MTDQERGVLGQHAVRMERLEKSNSRLRWIACASLALVWVPMLLGANTGPRNTIEASAFVVKDTEGRSIARLGYDVHRGPELVLFDTEGNERVGLRVAGGSNPQLVLMTKNAKPRAALGMSDDGSAGLFFSAGADFNARSLLGISENGSPNLIFWDEDGRPRVLLGSSPSAWVSLGIAEERPVSSIVLSDKEGKAVFKVP